MKTLSLLSALIFPTTALFAEDPPKLVPRPIPGMPAHADSAASPSVQPVSPAATAPAAPVLMTNPDRARVVYIHRRSTLPEALTKDLPVSKAVSDAPATMLNVRQGAVKIIPKAQVAQIITSKP